MKASSTAVKASSTTVKASSTTSHPTASAVTGAASVTELLGLSARPVAPEGIIAATAELMTLIAVAAHRIVPWIERGLVVEGVAPGGRRVVERVSAKLGRPIPLRIAVLESGKLFGVWKGWFFEVPRIGQLSRVARVIRPGAGVVEGAIAARIGPGVTAGRVWRTNSTRVWRTNSAGVTRSVVTASIARRYGVGIGNVNVAIVTDVAPTPIAAPIVVIVVDQRADEHTGPE